jgi:molybdopterin synthase catalytic subunit
MDDEREEFEPLCEITRDPMRPHRVARTVWTPRHGAVVTFTGIVRDHSEGGRVLQMFYETYPEMARKEILTILGEARERWPQVRVSVAHRVGWLEIGELSVVVAAGSAHREPAFEACRYTMAEVKRRAPIWKKELNEEGQAWVGLERGPEGT